MTRRVTVQLLLAAAVGVSFLLAETAVGVGVAGATPSQDPGATSTPTESVPVTVAPTDGSSTEVAPTTTAPASTGPRFVATITLGEAGKPLEGVEMVVSQNGKEIGREASDEAGKVAVDLPGAGKYEVTLDTETLPDGVSFEKGARTELTPTVQAIGDRPLVFRLSEGGESAAAGKGDVERFASLLASGIRFGLVIALAAVGLSLIFGTTGLTNFAHGELLTFGAMATWYLNSDVGGLGLPLLIAAIGGVIAAGLFGASFELGVYRPLRRRGMPVVSQMVVSIGLAFGLRYLFSVIYGAGSKQYSQYAAQAPTIELGPISVRPKDLVVSLIAIVALVAIGLFLQKARLGTAIRAVSDNRDLSVASGIDDKKVILMVWVLSGLMAGLAGIMLGSTDNVQWTMGSRVLLIMFAAVLLGGLGTTFGAMFGGLFVGIVSDLSTFWLDADLKIVVALATLVAVLLVRPQGVFGVKARTA